MTHEETEALAREIGEEIAQSPILRTVIEYSHVDECSRIITSEIPSEPPIWCVRLIGLDDNRFPKPIHDRAEWAEFKAELLERWPEGIHRAVSV